MVRSWPLVMQYFPSAASAKVAWGRVRCRVSGESVAIRTVESDGKHWPLVAPERPDAAGIVRARSLWACGVRGKERREQLKSGGSMGFT